VELEVLSQVIFFKVPDACEDTPRRRPVFVKASKNVGPGDDIDGPEAPTDQVRNLHRKLVSKKLLNFL